ncbi:hypothetical protein PS726_01871 [Pseudomonas fluorescens]|uniref:hypothetical protein n=1 Tax=Pseudomonas fluorescens TaxID=294 RepID=UPI000FA2037F|nr:hypothetical protein [Pseudomonas fluorescens]VVM60332.1 hypothetical protein PS647_01266 [Pseudomonas fluorescens]VVN90902.1 hypothetical protein PS726_01871 [Pseudomonas fluorescens]VVO57089.1 hypothetical protein PS843_00584 [Pseudomonas fluorescens]
MRFAQLSREQSLNALLLLKMDAECVVLLSDSPKLFVELVRVLLFGRELPDQRFIVTIEQDERFLVGCALRLHVAQLPVE